MAKEAETDRGRNRRLKKNTFIGKGVDAKTDKGTQNRQGRESKIDIETKGNGRCQR